VGLGERFGELIGDNIDWGRLSKETCGDIGRVDKLGID